VSFRIVGFDFQRLLVISDCFVHIAHFEQSNSEVVVGHRAAGVDLQRRLVLSDRSSTLPFGQNVAEVDMTKEVVRRAGERVSPQRFTVSPISGLRARAKNQSRQNDRGEAASTTRR